MELRSYLAFAAIVLSAATAQADDSAVILGKSSYNKLCAHCHGKDAKGGGEVAALFKVPPANLTKLAERADGRYPFPDVYHIIVNGMEQRGHGDAEMPIWGDFFLADSLEDRGVSATDAVYIASGRILSLVYYLETLQE